jgi:hypothetical protein
MKEAGNGIPMFSGILRLRRGFTTANSDVNIPCPNIFK